MRCTNLPSSKPRCHQLWVGIGLILVLILGVGLWTLTTRGVLQPHSSAEFGSEDSNVEPNYRALRSLAQRTVEHGAISHSSLVAVLTEHGASREVSKEIIDSLDINWIHQAHQAAETLAPEHLSSQQQLIDFLKRQGFNLEEATYGATNAAIDWEQRAITLAQQYVDRAPFSRVVVIERLKHNGFTHSQSVRAVDQLGVEWKVHAHERAQTIVNNTGFAAQPPTREFILNMLDTQGFTEAEAQYALGQVRKR